MCFEPVGRSARQRQLDEAFAGVDDVHARQSRLNRVVGHHAEQSVGAEQPAVAWNGFPN